MTPEQERKLLEDINTLFDQIPPPETEEEVNQSLLDAGYDPDEVAEHFRNLAKRILGEDAE